MGRKSFLKGAAILALAGVAVRAIGALYRIPLTNILGTEGVALYQMAYPVYGLLLTLSTAGIPGAISKMVSERLVRRDRRNATMVFRVSLAVLSGVGLVSAAAMALGSHQVARLIAGSSAPLAQPSMLAAAPALFFVAVITAYRGYFQGLQNMAPTAISQIIEQAVKIVPGFFIAARLNRISVELGAAGAMWGVALSEAVALIYLMIRYAHAKRREEMEDPGTHRQHPAEPFGAIARSLARLALPMMVGAIFLPLAGLADAVIVMHRLTWPYFSGETARRYYGILSTVNAMVNIPGVLSLSLATSLIPAVAESHERGDWKAVERKSRVGLRMAMLVSMPSAVGLAVMAKPILGLLFGSAMTPEELAIGAGLLATSSGAVVFLAVVQATNGSLQGLGRVYVPMVSLAVGAVVKIVLNYILVGIHHVWLFGTVVELNIHGAPVGTVACYLIPSAINLVCLRRATGMRLDWSGSMVRPLLASLAMGVTAWGVLAALAGPVGRGWATMLAVIAAVPAYASFAVLFGVLGRDEFSHFPGGGKLAALLARHGILRG